MTWLVFLISVAPIASYLVGMWIGYDMGRDRGFEACRKKWVDSLLEKR